MALKQMFRYPINLFLPLPFAYWIGEVVIAVYIIFIVFCSIIIRLRTNNGKVSLSAISVALFTTFYVFISVCLFKGTFADWFRFGPHDQTFLLLQAIQFFLFIVIVSLVGKIDREQYVQYVTYVFVLLLATTFIESFATNVLNAPHSIFPAYRESWVYNQPVIGNYCRPFGLTGSAPMNASIMVVMMWLYIGLKEKRGVAALKIHAVTIIALLANYSGQAILSYVATIMLYSFRLKTKHLIDLTFIFGIAHIVLSTGLLGDRLTYAYMFRVLEYLTFGETMSVLSITHVLFGALGNVPALNEITNEFHLVHSIARFGLIVTMFMWILILSHKAENREIKMGLWAAFFGSLHYASILIVVLQVPLALLLVNWKHIYHVGKDGKTLKKKLGRYINKEIISGV